MRLIHCGNVDVCAVYEPILVDKATATSFGAPCDSGDKKGQTTYVGDHDSGDRTEEDCVTAHESQEARRTVQQGMRHYIRDLSSGTHAPGEYFPWTKCPSANECADDLAAPNVNIARPERSHVVPSAKRVGRDVRA